jgi:hypothetical protein
MANNNIYDDDTRVKDMDEFKDGVVVFDVQDPLKIESSPLNATSGNTSSQPSLNISMASRPNEARPSQKSIPSAPQQSLPAPHAHSPESSFFVQDENSAGQQNEGEYARQTQYLLNGAEYQRQMPTPPQPYVMVQHARSIEELIAEQEEKGRIKQESKAQSREESSGSRSSPSTGVKPEPSDHQDSMQSAPVRSPSPVEDRPVNDYFVSADSQAEGAEQTATFQGNLLQKIVNSESLQLLEDATKVGANIIDSMEAQLSPQTGDLDAAHWLAQMNKLRKQLSRNRTVVGVVGNTGAGKSSVINALLDEERVVPTSCMRACTAVVTEISWNESDKPSEKYRAEIEFISKDC